MTLKFNPGIPEGPLADKWDKHKFDTKLVNPANKRKYKIIIIGTGLAGASAAATLGELGYEVEVFTYHDSARRAHSIAAQGGINAAKNYPNDGDSIFRLFYDTVKGGDYRSRESNVYRLAQVSNEIIDQSVAQGVPYAREYGGLLDNRSFGGAQVSRTFYARGQTGQQLLLGAYQAHRPPDRARHGHLPQQIRRCSTSFRRTGRAVGVVIRDLVTGEVTPHSAHAVMLATGGYSNVYYLSTNAMCVQRNRCMEGAPQGRLRLPTHPSHRSTRRAYLPRMSISRSSLSCLSRCATTDAFGCRRTADDDRAAE